MYELILGIDDAGRGPVIGPMILAGCLIKKKTEEDLREIGVKDSKELTQKRREIISEKIKSVSESFDYVIVEPEEIDQSNYNGIKLNELEAIKIAEIINKINSGKSKIKVVVDCPSVSILKWRDFLMTKIDNLSNLEIVCEHKADKNHLAVSAASIIAKTIREKEMTKLKKIYGEEIGSGYTSDPATIRFLEKNAIKLKNKKIFRKTWATWKDALKKKEQKELF